MRVEFAGVSKRYATSRSREVLALEDFSLVAEHGELIVLVGPSGSGKSTALRILAGLETATAGVVRIGDRDVTNVAPHQRDVAMVFQDYALYPHLTVADNLGFGLRVRRERDVDARVRRVAEQLGFAELLDRHPDQLSGGQQQRVALGRAMLREPGVYLMDEPLSSLDAQLRMHTRAEIVRLHRALETTTLYVTHDQGEAMTMGDRIAVLAGGTLQQFGTPEEIYDEPANRFVAGFVGSPPMNLVGGGGVLGGANGEVVGVRPEDLRVSSDGPIAATVTVVERLGSETVLDVQCSDGTQLAVRTPPRSGHAPGDSMRLLADPERLHRFDAASGRRVDG